MENAQAVTVEEKQGPWGFWATIGLSVVVMLVYLAVSLVTMIVFAFAFAEHHSEPLVPITPRRISNRMPFEPGIVWLWNRLRGEDIPAPGRAPGPINISPSSRMGE